MKSLKKTWVKRTYTTLLYRGSCRKKNLSGTPKMKHRDEYKKKTFLRRCGTVTGHNHAQVVSEGTKGSKVIFYAGQGGRQARQEHQKADTHFWCIVFCSWSQFLLMDAWKPVETWVDRYWPFCTFVFVLKPEMRVNVFGVRLYLKNLRLMETLRNGGWPAYHLNRHTALSIYQSALYIT